MDNPSSHERSEAQVPIEGADTTRQNEGRDACNPLCQTGEMSMEGTARQRREVAPLNDHTEFPIPTEGGIRCVVAIKPFGQSESVRVVLASPPCD